jgi:hypothetical protein
MDRVDGFRKLNVDRVPLHGGKWRGRKRARVDGKSTPRDTLERDSD